MIDSDGIQHTEIDGVRTVWAPCEGPLRACLTFRVGMADETYLTAGISHMIEHLALFGIADPARHNNGHVDQTTTAFHTHGKAADVTAFLSRVTEQLHQLPLHRLEQERSVLAAEAASRGRSVARELSVWRFGAQGYGLAGAGRWGERLLGPAALQSWAADRFTRDNAVLWLSGPPPADLRLDLPAGRHCAPPEPVTLLPREPGWFQLEHGGVASSAVLARGAASAVLLAVLKELLHERLRLLHAISYSPWLTSDRLTGTLQHLITFADAAPERRAELVHRFSDLLASLQALPPDRVAELQRDLVTQMDTSWADHPDEARVGTLANTAFNLLTGGPLTSHEQWRTELSAVTATQYYDAATALVAGGLYALPPEGHPTPLLGEPVPHSLTLPVQGRARRHRDAPVLDHRLIVTPEGVTRQMPDGHLTVRYNDLVGALQLPDGALTLVGRDAVHLTIEPTSWRRGKQATAQVAAAVPAHLHAPLPAREAAEIPKPATTWWQRQRAAGQRAGRFDISPVLLIGLIVVLTVCGIAGFAYGTRSPQPFVLPMLLMVWAAFRLRRRRSST